MEFLFGSQFLISYSCIKSIHNRAISHFLGKGKYTPNAAVYGEIGWNPIIVEQWKEMGNHLAQTPCLRESRMYKKIFNWAFNRKGEKCKKLVLHCLTTLCCH
jgi:hypothetical protein